LEVTFALFSALTHILSLFNHKIKFNITIKIKNFNNNNKKELFLLKNVYIQLIDFNLFFLYSIKIDKQKLLEILKESP